MELFILGVTAGPDPAIEIIKNRLSNVKHKIIILSGKGGVGKSTVTSLLGHALSKLNPDVNVSQFVITFNDKQHFLYYFLSFVKTVYFVS